MDPDELIELGEDLMETDMNSIGCNIYEIDLGTGCE